METKRDDDHGWTLMGRLMLLGASQVASGCALGLYLRTKERNGRSVPQRALGEIARHDHAHTGGASRSGRIREEAKVSESSKTVRFLAQVPLFRGLKKRQLWSLARSMTPRRYAAGEVVLCQGKGGISLFVVVSGRAEAVHTRADGMQVVVNTFGPTDYFGELAVLNDEPRTATVVAVEDTECLVLVRWDFLGKLVQHRGIAAVILQEQSRRFQRALAVL